MAIMWFRTRRKPDIQILTANTRMVNAELEASHVIKLFPMLLDASNDYAYTNARDWAKVFDYIYFKFRMPRYLEARMDCDDFAFLLKGLVASFFGLNYFGVVLGTKPDGGHAWNIFETENGLFCIEPQTGEFFPLGEQSYKPQWALI